MSSSAPEQTVRSFPTFGIAVVLLLIALGASTGLSIPVAVLKILKFDRVAGFLLFPVQIVAFGITIWIAKLWSRRTWVELLALRPVSSHVWVPLLLGVAGLLFLVIGVDALVNHVLPEPAWLGQIIMGSGGLVIVVGAPLTEEALFRSVILGGFLKRYGYWKAILLSALLFALFHLNPWQLLPPFMIGLFAGWVFSETRSIWPVITAHLLHNGICYAGQRFQVPYLSDNQHLPPLWFWGLGLLLLSLGVLGLNRAFGFQASQARSCRVSNETELSQSVWQPDIADEDTKR